MSRSVVVPWLSRGLRWLVASLSVAVAVIPTATLCAEDAGVASDAGGSGAKSWPSRKRSLGGLTAEQVSQTIALGLRPLEQCYETLLETQPWLRGRVSIEFVVDRAGKVREARVESNQTGSRALGDCVLRQARSWTFSEPLQGEATYRYPFEFAPTRNGESAARAEGIPLPTPIPPSVPDPERPGSVEAFVQRFGACAEVWREGHVPSALERKSFEATAIARPKPAQAAKGAHGPAGPEEYLYQVETCYVRALEVPAWAGIKGRLALRLAIGADGKVVAARASANELVPELGCCIQNAALEWRFSASGAFRVADYTLALTQPAGQGVDVRLID